ncbi:hydroxypyruvate isomerase [Marinobacterium sediminicola]|uniref:Hydroxypyruvate isomerase n=1 Tax=Marinobacterium sediminicola TaxID=518898 RepID=A0ABY1RXM5_9GAMM|nr:hydroxypyruvate isomerase [Marinobacterium sediminicola]ULG70765.1 hydroxypyruvate isomerase [Marinobacterium sediminicola]SMR71659.1 hydroxypyruvate isomerase [Marinobacterium sediminicola]
MLKFAANLSLLFTEYPLIQRFGAARAAGFDAVEVQFPYTLTPEAVRKELQDHALKMVLINLPAGNWEAGDRGLACLPGREDEFAESVDLAIEWAKTLGVERLNCLAGVPPENVPAERVSATLAHNLKLAAQRCEGAGIELMIEAINNRDVPGFYLHHSHQVLDLIRKLELPATSLQYDVYHMQMMEGNLISTLQQNADKIGHIQIADVPGRHEPGTGEINFTNLFKALESQEYKGYISLEYIPRCKTEAGLGWLKTWKTQDERNELECSG